MVVQYHFLRLPMLMGLWMAGILTTQSAFANVINSPLHGHGPSPVTTWPAAPPAAGTEQHQHRTNHNPDGTGSIAHDSVDPYEANGAWMNDRTYHDLDLGHADFAHGHMDTPARFHVHDAAVGGDITQAEANAWDADAADRSSEAFNAWSNAGTADGLNWPNSDDDSQPGTGERWHSTVNWEQVVAGAAAHEVHVILGEADIDPHCAGADTAGCWDFPNLTLVMDDDVDWYYGLEPVEGPDGMLGTGDDVAPDQFDFFTTILHEVGHVVGLVHFGTCAQRAIMWPDPQPVRKKTADCGILHTIDASATHGVRDLYAIVPAPGSLLLLVAGVVGMLVSRVQVKIRSLASVFRTPPAVSSQPIMGCR